jgi:hypothetical protein
MLRPLALVALLCVLTFGAAGPWIGLLAAAFVAPLLAAPWIPDELGRTIATYAKCVLVFFIALEAARIAVIGSIKYRLGYSEGVAAVAANVANGTVHQYAQQDKGRMWCLVIDSTAPSYRRFCGHKFGVYESLPLHSGDEDFARETPEQLGAVCKTDGSNWVTAITAENARITDAELHWLDAFPHLEELTLVSAPISDNAIKYLVQLRSLKQLTIIDSRLSEHGTRKLINTYPAAVIRDDLPIAPERLQQSRQDHSIPAN